MSWLYSDPRPQAVSQKHIPEELGIDKIDSVDRMSAVLGRKARNAPYDPTKPLLEDLCRIYEIKRPGPCWEALEAGSRDGAEALEDFKLEYENLHPEAQLVDNRRAAAPPAIAPPRRTDVLLTKGPPIAPEPSKLPDFLSIQGFPTQFGPGRFELGFELSCGVLKAKVADIAVTIRSGILTLKCFPAQIDKSTRKGFGEPWSFEGTQGPVSFSWSVGDTYNARWRVTASGKTIGSLEVPPDFVTVCDAAPGDEFELSFRFCIKDTTADVDEILDFASDLEVEPPQEQAEKIDVSTLSEVKKKLIARIATAALVDEGDGFVVHARHKMAVAKNDQ